VGNHQFIVYVEDHAEPGAGADRFWIEIADRDGNVIAVSSMDREAADNAVTLGGGNIVVPHTTGGGGGGDDGQPKDVSLVGRGVRLLPGGTTDVWALGDYAYLGTFNTPCGDGSGENGSGIRIFDISDPAEPMEVPPIPSVLGSRSNDVKVATMNSGDILVHSNESCAGGPGGFEVWNVDDPLSPVYLAHVGPINELNPISDALFGGITDVGVHNLWLFTDGNNDYVAAVAESAFDNLRIYDITDPTNPVRVAAWGAEELFDPGVGDETGDVNRVLDAALWLLDGFGEFRNRFLHDVTVSADGNTAVLSYWDAGFVTLDISDPANPLLISVAIDPVNGSLDGEVNSHAAWPSEDGSIVVEGEEDFSTGSDPKAWGGLRVWDTSDPFNPVLASTFHTTCSADPEDPSCEPGRAYSAHNIVVETNDKGQVRAYISWYADGMLVLDVTDPYAPIEIARYAQSGAEFEAQNGGPQDFWGVYKEPGSRYILGSDRNGGLYILADPGAKKGGRRGR
jgi:hypothetical protein